jgi:hypothetical protein
MDMLMALAVSIGVLIALWVKFGGMIGVAIAVPAGIVAWACFYAAGGKMRGLQKAIAANVSGVIWVLLANVVISGAGLQSFAWILIGIVAFLIVMQSRVPALSFIPGGFCGAAVTAASGAGTDIRANLMVAVALIIGAVLGYVSEMVGAMMAKKA